MHCSRWRTGLAALLAFAACDARAAGESAPSAAAERPASERWFVRAGDDAFGDAPVAHRTEAFDVVATDMDLDGDTDLLINWHHLAPLELFENRGGRFALVRPDRAGLFENRDVDGLYAPHEEMAARASASSEAGLFVWHDEDREGAWRLLWKDGGAYGGLRVALETSLGFAAIEGLSAGELVRDGRRAQIRIDTKPSAPAERSIEIRTQRVGVQLAIRVEASPSGATPALFVGRNAARSPHSAIRLWKDDPHGIAWLDAEGGPRPELFLTRGGLAGLLVPPLDPKTDRYYVAQEAGRRLHRFAAPGVVPASYGRGRRVEWVDADGDGRLALSISNEQTPNALLVRDASGGAFTDGAPERGIDFREGHVQAWADHDGDGRQDLFHVEGDRVDVARNTGSGRRFERLRGDGLGLVLPAAERGAGLFDWASIRLADFDADGALDLWVLGHGADRTSHVFRRDGPGFTDVSKQLGLEAARGARVFVLLDVDNDGYEDVLSFGSGPLLWHNRAGKRFDFVPLPADLVPEPIHAATALDADGDGATDVVLVGRNRHLLLNRAGRERGHLDVVLRGGERPPVGALVRAHYADSRIVARRYGSAVSTAFSQALQPLRFGIGTGARIDAIGVVWPGRREEEMHPVSPAVRQLEIERR